MKCELAIPTLVLLLAGCPRYDPSATVNTPPASQPAPAAMAEAEKVIGTDGVIVEALGDAEDEAPMLVFNKVISNDGTYVVRYAATAGIIPLNEPFDLVVTVMENAEPQRPVRDAHIDIDGRMPHHHHGMSLVPRVEAVETGRFEVEGMQFHMPGYWEIHVDITRDEVTERAQFVVNLD